jgi:RimJ/RimL family protein N-acetyltransferase
MNRGIEIRHIRESDDIDAISRVFARSWKTAYRGIVPDDYLDSLQDDRWSKRFTDLDKFLIVTENDEIIGVTKYSPARDIYYPDWGEIVAIYLLPSHYHRGIGTQLIRAAVNELQSLGFDKIYLWVLEENRAARSFYEKNGFASNGDAQKITIGDKALNELRYVYKNIEL